VVIIEFQLHIDGRKAADDVREKVASVRPTCATRSRSRACCASTRPAAVWSLAVLPDEAAGRAALPVELTTWADQVLKKRLENVRGVGAVNLVGATKREINIYLDPPALEAYGITPDQVPRRCAARTRTCPWARSARWPRSAWCRSTPACSARGFRPHHRGAPRRARCAWPGGRVVDGAQELESLALYNGSARCCCRCRRPGREHHRGGRRPAAVAEMRPSCRRRAAGAHATTRAPSAWRGQRAPDADRGRLLTVLIVFLFLNSWRSTVITGLTLPIALIGTFLFMYCSASPST
jgi:HAE1 family hydrophobic/amphiphilic exporter-1